MSIKDVDSRTLKSATITLVDRPDDNQEFLRADTLGTSLTSHYESTTGVLDVSGPAQAR